MQSAARLLSPTWAVVVWLIAAPILLVPSAQAVPILFTGIDLNSGAGAPHPLSDAAAAAFDAAAGALGPMAVIDFETLLSGSFNSMPIGGGVTASMTGHDFGDSGIAPDGYAGTVFGAGHNTTSGGVQFIAFAPQFNIGTATLVFSFATPIQAFGIYLTDLEDDLPGDLTITFDDGIPQAFPIAKMTCAPTQPLGCDSTQFWGFTDSGASITQVTFRLDNVVSGEGLRDVYGVDDLRIVPVPEPASITLILTGLLAMARRRSRGK